MPDSKSNKIIHRDGKYAAIPNSVLRDVNISIGARGLLAMLMSHSEDWRFNRKNIMEKCGCGDAKYNRLINELKGAGYLKITSSQDDDGKMKGYDWIINPHPKTESDDNETNSAENPTIDKPARIRKPSNKKTKSKKPPNPQGNDLSDSDIFEKLWIFIKKVTPKEYMGRHSKKNGLAKFLKITERKKDPVPAGKMAHAICWYYTQNDQQRDGAKYIKGILPVLNGELFEAFLDYGPYGSIEEKSDKELAADKNRDYWDFWVRRYADQGDWSAPGPNPDDPECLAPKDILQTNGFTVGDDSIDT